MLHIVVVNSRILYIAFMNAFIRPAELAFTASGGDHCGGQEGGAEIAKQGKDISYLLAQVLPGTTW